MNRWPVALQVTIFGLLLGSLGGCDDNARVAQVAERAAERQAELDKEMAQLNRQVAEGSKELVEADARSREALVGIQKDLQIQQAQVNHQRDELEKERKAIAEERVRESILAPILANLGPLVVCGLVLLFCCLLLWGLRVDRKDDDAVGEVLVEELTSQSPILLPSPNAPKAIEHCPDGPAAITDKGDPLHGHSGSA